MFRELDENGDIKAGTFLRGAEAVGANIATQIQQWARENPQDLTQGIDWALELSDFNEGRLTAQIRDIAFRCNHVTEVTEGLTITGPDEDRFLHISFGVLTTFGETNVQVQVNGENY